MKFTHRRFLEFFTARKLLSGLEGRPSLASGYLDSNRDMLRLYGGVCNEAEAQQLAAEAMQHIRKGQMQAGFVGYEIALIALRFLRDTFRARAGILRPYSTELNNVVVKLWNSADLMKQKHAAEHLCLLPAPVATRILAESLKTKCGWLWRAALFEARYVSNMQPWLAMHITRYASRSGDWDHLLLRRFLRDTHSTRGGAVEDAVHLAVDSAARTIIVGTLIMGCLWLSNFAIGVICFAILLLFIWRLGEPSFAVAMEHVSPPTANVGAAGLLAAVIPWAFFWEIVHIILGHKTTLRGSAVELTVASSAVAGAIALRVNNKIAIERERHWDSGLDLEMKALLQRFDLKKIDYLGAVRRNLLFAAVLIFVIASTWFAIANDIVSGFHMIIFGFAALGVFYALITYLSSVALYALDWFVIRRLKSGFQPHRRCIAKSLLTLHTDLRRHMFLNWVEENRDNYVSSLASPADDWPDGLRPRFKDYLLNNKLAIYDEKWRGLNQR